MSARTAVTLVFALNGAAIGTWGARIPAIKDHADVGNGGLAIPLALLAIGALVAMPLSGRLSARHGSRVVTAAGIVLLGLVLPLPALLSGLTGVAVGAFFVGAANGLVDVAMNAQGVTVERRLGRPILSGLHAGFSFGGLAGAVVAAGAASLDVDVLPHFIAAGAVVTGAGALAARHLVADVVAPPSEPVRRAGADASRRRLWQLRALAFVALFAEGAALDWGALHLRELGAGAGVAALAYAGFSLAMASGRVAGDRVTARWGPEPLARRGAVLGAGALAVALLVATPAVALVAYVGLGLGLAVLIPLIFRAAAEGGDAAGPALASVTSTGYLGLLAGPPAIGLFAEATSLPTALALVAVATALIAAGAGVLRPAPGAVAPAA